MPPTPPTPSGESTTTIMPSYNLTWLGVGGASPFQDLLDQAIVEGWSQAQLEEAIINDPRFEQMFPGIKRPDGSLRMNAAEYRSLAEMYYNIGQDYGISIGKDQVGLLVVGGISPSEFTVRAQVIKNVRDHPNLLEAYNEVRRTDGLTPMSEDEWFRSLAGQGTPDFYDHYEAAQIRSTVGLDISAEGALRAATALGGAGEYLDVTMLAQAARDMKPDIGPELMRAGISDEDLVKLEGGVDERGIASQVATIIANRRSQGRFVAGEPARIGTGGRLATLPEERPESF